jgi:molybdopterin synthase sulfur carrier subunit
MIRVYFFAKIKEQLSLDFFDLNIKTPCTVSEIRKSLISEFNTHEKLFRIDYAICAVNHELSDEEKSVKSNDEVAFFPPVTGG